jgi:putative hydrolase of HD superfamily
VRTKGELPLTAFAGRSLEPLVAAYFELNHLKQLYRQGWLRRGVPPERCESVADHVFGMAVLGWWIAGSSFPELDCDRVVRITLAHELGEIYAGDLTPADGIPVEEKRRLERAGLRRVVDKLPNGEAILALWEEFEAGQSPEARFVRQLDRLEMAFQAAVYQAQGFGEMREFFTSAGQVLSEPVLREMLAKVEGLGGRDQE